MVGGWFFDKFVKISYRKMGGYVPMAVFSTALSFPIVQTFSEKCFPLAGLSAKHKASVAVSKDVPRIDPS
jgi:hypothetical protein